MADADLCALRECSNPPARGRLGFCNSHYKKLVRHGNPRGGRQSRRAKDGEPTIWLLAHVGYEGDNCLKWPFAHRGNGYGILSATDHRRGVSAHRYMCELAHGPAPTDAHLAAHSCGQGHNGCVNPRHIRWATPAENAEDRIKHGTAQRGERNAVSKLTVSDVLFIRSSWPDLSQNQLAARFAVDQATIWRILHRRAWAWL